LGSLTASLAQARDYQKSFETFGLQNIEEIIQYFANWQKGLTEHYPDNPDLFLSLMLAALEIICWQRKDYEPIQDILKGS
jgi:hypothetical protein